jgi:hypothetical protein
MTAVAMMLVALLAFSAPAMAQSKPLSVKTAKKFARGLGQQQKRENDVVVFHVYGLKRVNQNTITFKYDERTKSKGYCTAILRVKQSRDGTTTRVTARLLKHQCALIPRDALAVERATGKANRRVRRNERAVLRAVRRVSVRLAECEDLRIPRNRRNAAEAIIGIGFIGAVRAPNDAALDSFVADLADVNTSNTVIRRAVAGWADYVEVLRAFPAISNPCATLKTWDNADWAADEAPIDMAAYRELSLRADDDEDAINRAARYLARVGVFPKVAGAFTIDGLLLRYLQD